MGVPHQHRINTVLDDASAPITVLMNWHPERKSAFSRRGWVLTDRDQSTHRLDRRIERLIAVYREHPVVGVCVFNDLTFS